MFNNLFRIPLLVAAASMILAACAAPTPTPAPATEQPAAIQAPTKAPATEQPTATQAPTATETPLTVKATATPGELDGCVPACVRGFVAPGNLPAGEYQTQNFFGGRMEITLEGEWTSGEDSTGEFRIAPKATPNDWILFWEDVYPVENGVHVEGVPLTAEGLLHWLSTNPNFETTAPVAGMIGADIQATVVDVSIAAGATNDDPECPVDTCLNFLGFPQWDPPGTWGIAGLQVQRFYLADVSYGGVAHLFVVIIYPDDPADMESLRSLAEPLIASVRVPVDPQ